VIAGGRLNFTSKVGAPAGNHFRTIEEGREYLRTPS